MSQEPKEVKTPQEAIQALLSIGHALADTVIEMRRELHVTTDLPERWQAACAELFDAEVQAK